MTWTKLELTCIEIITDYCDGMNKLKKVNPPMVDDFNQRRLNVVFAQCTYSKERQQIVAKTNKGWRVRIGINDAFCTCVWNRVGNGRCKHIDAAAMKYIDHIVGKIYKGQITR